MIQPQPRGTADAPPITRKDSAGKSAWGNAKAAAASLAKLETGLSEFPTAAEVAQGQLDNAKSSETQRAHSINSGKLIEKKVPPQPTAAQKQAAADADAFRGVHLGPNVHHWDEVCAIHVLS